MTKPPTNLAASVHRRLLDGARQRGEDFQLTLLRFGAERLLFRLCSTEHADRFVLKGAMLLLLWQDQLYRPTRDVDLEGFGDTAPENLRAVFRAVCRHACPEDALIFDEESVDATPIRTTQDYGGVRVTLMAHLGKARIPIQVDIGFGDAITPAPVVRDFPTLLPLPAPRLRTYPLETVVAEKFEAMARLGRANSRMKDFFDLHMLARRCEFDGALLTRAVKATFERRNASMDDLAEVLAPDFYADSGLAQRWRAYLKSMPPSGDAPASLADTGAALLRFLVPLAEAMRGKQTLAAWSHDTGWRVCDDAG